MTSKVQEAMKASVVTKVKQNGSLAGLNQGDIASYIRTAMSDRIAAVLPKHLTPDRMIQMAATIIQKNPMVARCTPVSLLGAVMQASILGFPPVDTLGYCYFVPYKDAVQFQLGYRGMIELARRSGRIKMVYAEVVREGDEFNCTFGLEPTLSHTPRFDSSKAMTHVYAVCHFADGGYNFVVLSRSDVERLRMRSPMQSASPSGAWKTDYEAMAKAKALKQLSKYLPLSIDVQSAIESDGAVITPDSFTPDGEFKVEDAEYDVQDMTLNNDVHVDEATGEVIDNANAGELFGK